MQRHASNERTHALVPVGRWILGPVLCDLWLFADVCSCTSSIMHIVVISIDRYLAINDPLNVRFRQNKYRIGLLVFLIWFIAVLLSSPMIALGMINPHNIIINGQCVIDNQFFVIYGSVVSFVIPLIIVIIMYTLTVRRLKKQIEQCRTQFAQEQIVRTVHLVAKPFFRRALTSQTTINTSSQVTLTSATDLRRQRARAQTAVDSTQISLTDLSVPKERPASNEKALSNESLQRHRSVKASSHAEYACPKNPFCQLKCICQQPRLEPVQEGHSDSTCHRCCQTTDSAIALRDSSWRQSRPISLPASAISPPSTSNPAPTRKRQWSRLLTMPNFSSPRPRSSAVRNEQKAVKVLGVVFAIFVIAWFPFCIMNLLQGVCKRCSINHDLLNGFVWLGYVSSSINPLVYTIFNRNFRVKFIQLLKCQCVFRTDRQKQLSYYQSHSSLHGSRVQRSNGLIQNDIRRFNVCRERSETLSS